MARYNDFTVGEINVLSVILGTVCWFVIIAFLIFPVTLLFIFKCSVIGVAYLLYDNLYGVSTTDAAFAIGCSWKKSKLSVGLLLRVQGHLELTHIQNKFYATLLEPKVGNKPKYEKLYSCLVVFGGYVFRKLLPMDSLQLDKHIFLRNLEKEESLEHVVQEWMDKSYAELSPAWEMMISHVPSSPLNVGSSCDSTVYETAISFKIHHVFADGYSLLHILDILTDNRSPYLVKDPKESFMKKLLDILCFPANLRFLGGEAAPKHNPIKIANPQKSWRYAFTTVDLAPIKAIRQKYDVHFASVILTLTVGSIRQYLLDKHSSKKLPKYLVSANTLPLWPQHPALQQQLCNHWALGVIKSPVVDDDPLTRMLETEKDFLQFHSAGLQKVATNYLFPAAWLIPSAVAEIALQRDQFKYNYGLTSLVGGNKYQFLGQPVTHIYPLLTLIDSHPYTAFSWFTFTQSGKLDVTVAAPLDLFPDQNMLSKVTSQYFQTELEKLCKQCGLRNDIDSSCLDSRNNSLS